MHVHPRTRRSRARASLAPAAMVAAAIALTAPGLRAQEGGWVEGQITSTEGPPLPSATVGLVRFGLTTIAASGGRYLLGPIPAGAHALRAEALGYRSALADVAITQGDTVRADFVLETRPLSLTGIDVSVLRPTLRPQTELEQRQAREANPRDVGDLLRKLPGVSSVRRGSLGLDPVVRGLRETEVGVYLDGTRQFPAGPARMDSPLSHLDPSTLKNIEVVKGPYALTWGAGNMSAIRVRTQSLPPAVPGPLHGHLLTGYDGNLGATETSGSVVGSSQRVSWWGSGAWRDGSAYEDGSGVTVPGGYTSWEARGKLGFQLAPASKLVVGGGYQKQSDIDYPGLILDAKYFETTNLSARYTLTRSGGVLDDLEVLAYVNDVDHGMDNDGKPTAQPNPDRMPPFPLDVAVDAGIRVSGGRVAATLSPDPLWQLEVGGDVYRAQRAATRTIHRRDTGMLMFSDLMWPDALITDAGLFARATRAVGGTGSLAAALRLDGVRADADSVSDFFASTLDGTGASLESELESHETNFSGALTLTLQPAAGWSLSLGVGSVVRTADATERYSDRIPASKAQTSAEFVGSPGLKPERSTQADVWLDGRLSSVSVSFNLFARRVDDYITLEATDLPKRLPLSPNTVYRYINGQADFWGTELSATAALDRAFTLTAQGGYLWARDRTLDEPALGIPPLHGDVSLRWERPDQRFNVEAIAHMAASQERVATSRGEKRTGGYTTFDLHAGAEVLSGTRVRFGVDNLLDRWYVNALNARNPFSGRPIAEPGRVAFIRLEYAF